MASDEEVTPKMLHWSDLRSLCASEGPCITITLPAYHRGAGSLPYSTNLNVAVRLVQQLLLKQNVPRDVEELVGPIRNLAKDLETSSGGPDRVIFRSPGEFRQFSLPAPVPAHTVVGLHFHLLPFLNQLCVDRDFYILGLNEKHLHLLHYSDGDCEEVPLPYGLANNAEAAGAFDPPDHTLRDRSAAGQSSGKQSAVVFGTSSEREKAHERLQEFFRLLDQGLSKALGGQQLLLSGVDYEVAMYRRASTYRFLMEGSLERDLHDLRIQEIARRASEYSRIQARGQAEKQLHLLRETAGTERTSFDIHSILKAAEEGRVAKLILGLGEEAASGATLEGGESESQEDLLNAAAVLTIRTGTEVFILPASAMAPLGRVAASFRY